MNILTAEEMGAVDRRTAEEFGVPLESLMERAGNAVATFCLQQYGSESRTVVLCGKGNNGGAGGGASPGGGQRGGGGWGGCWRGGGGGGGGVPGAGWWLCGGC